MEKITTNWKWQQLKHFFRDTGASLRDVPKEIWKTIVALWQQVGFCSQLPLGLWTKVNSANFEQILVFSLANICSEVYINADYYVESFAECGQS